MFEEISNVIDLYQRKHPGIYGEFGAGANARVRFIQTAMHPESLLSVSLISSLPGSEKWDVKDLFQRNVDSERVTNSIMPYLESKQKIKFFNPLTLVVLPLDETGKAVNKQLPRLEKKNEEKFVLWENSPFYQLRVSNDGVYGAIEWNSEKCRLVAIDGQHRLSAIQRIYRQPEPKVEISSWKVPVVIIVIEKDDPAVESFSLLQLIRNTFVYINTQAVRINASREILLNDESPVAICTQEFVRYCHKNDTRPLESREDKRIPLLAIDWRGDTSNERVFVSPAALKSVEEIKLWHEAYLIGEDFSDDQRNELYIDDAIPPLHGFRKDGALSASEADTVRSHYSEKILPGLMHFIEEFIPYKDYIANIRLIERQYINQSDIMQHAFMQLRFGVNDAPEEQKNDVYSMYQNLVSEIAGIKGSLPVLIKKDIGMRAVIYALGRLKRLLTEDFLSQGKPRPDWIEFSKLSVGYFNELFNEHWFDDPQDQTYEGSEQLLAFLHLIVFESNGNIANYRISDQEGGFGSILALVVGSRMVASSVLSDSAFKELWEEQQIVLGRTIEKEARKMHKAILRPTFQGKIDQFNSKVKELAKETAADRLSELWQYLEP